MPYVERDQNNKVVGVYNRRQLNATELLSSNDPAILSFLSGIPNDVYNSALLAGLTVTWQVSTTLNATYGVSPQMQIFVLTELLSLVANNQFTNGNTTRQWPDNSGTLRTFSIAQFKVLAAQIMKYNIALYMALLTAQNGGTPSWPSSSVTVNQ